jgi:hypothetical protein
MLEEKTYLILAISPFSISCLNISLYRKYHLIFFVQIDLKCQIKFWLYSKGQVDKLNAWPIFNMPLLLDSTSRIAYQFSDQFLFAHFCDEVFHMFVAFLDNLNLS